MGLEGLCHRVDGIVVDCLDDLQTASTLLGRRAARIEKRTAQFAKWGMVGEWLSIPGKTFLLEIADRQEDCQRAITELSRLRDEIANTPDLTSILPRLLSMREVIRNRHQEYFQSPDDSPQVRCLSDLIQEIRNLDQPGGNSLIQVAG